METEQMSTFVRNDVNNYGNINTDDSSNVLQRLLGYSGPDLGSRYCGT